MKKGIIAGRPRRTLLVLLAAALLVSGTTAAAVSIASEESKPYISTFAKSGESGLVITFNSADFIDNIVGDGELEGIVLTSLPDESEGTLYCGDRALYLGEAVTTENLDRLYFDPTGDAETTASFSFIPVFTESNGKITTVSMAQVKKHNNPPVAMDAEYETIKNIAVTCKFKVSDPDGDELTCHIQNPPKKGDVVISEEDPMAFIYTPYQNKVGTDSFTYVAVDSEGKTSETAKITIRISKNGAKMTYADMEGNPSHFAAIKLAEEGILIGERMGKSYFFNPDKVVTRGEFVAMALTCLDIEVSTPVTKTGFADDSETPAWVKPYISTALKNGIISGASTFDGRRVFRSENPLTRAEAAVILNNALSLDEAGNAPVFSDGDAVPAWAAEAASRTAALGIIPVAADGSLHPMSNVTRADAAQLLYNAMKVHEESKPRGLLSRIFG
jgi:hypothetical protein